jgi:hypothetical protein
VQEKRDGGGRRGLRGIGKKGTLLLFIEVELYVQDDG